jgi:hypothetical protein
MPAWLGQPGLSEDTIQAITHGTTPQGLTGDEAILVGYVPELLRHHNISDATCNVVRDCFEMQRTLEITARVGHYVLVGQSLAAFKVDWPEEATLDIPESIAARGSSHGAPAGEEERTSKRCGATTPAGLPPRSSPAGAQQDSRADARAFTPGLQEPSREIFR